MTSKEQNPTILHFEIAKSSVKERNPAFLHFGDQMMMSKEQNPTILHFERAKASMEERKGSFLHFEGIYGELVVGEVCDTNASAGKPSDTNAGASKPSGSNENIFTPETFVVSKMEFIPIFARVALRNCDR